MEGGSILIWVDGEIRFDLDLRVYRLAAVQRAGYRLARQCTARLGSPDGDTLPVALAFPEGTAEAAARAAARRFFQELLDQELREKVRDETAQVRALLMAVAFSRTGLAPRE